MEEQLAAPCAESADMNPESPHKGQFTSEARRLLATPLALGRDRLLYLLLDRETQNVMIGRPEDINVGPSILTTKFELRSSFYIRCEKKPAKRVLKLLLNLFEENRLSAMNRSSGGKILWLDSTAREEAVDFLRMYSRRLGPNRPPTPYFT
jgi:hypothetical protein